MTIYSSLVNTRTKIRVTETTAPIKTGGGTDIYVTIPNWSSFSSIDRIVISTDTAYTSPIILSILSNGAAHRALSLTANGLSDTGADNVFVYDIDSYVEDELKSGFCYLRITATTGVPFEATATFDVLVEGTRYLNGRAIDSDRVSLKGDKSFRVLRESGGIVSDLTKALSMDGNPTAVTVFSAAADKLYIGSADIIKYLKFVVATPIADENVFDAEYWNGSAWAALGAATVDNTSSGQYDAGTGTIALEYSGVVQIPTISGWKQTKLANDPYTVLMTQISSGLAYPMGMSYDPQRYWLRLTNSATVNASLFSLHSLVPDLEF